MRRQLVITSLSLFAACSLAGCGQKGPLTLPPTKPATSAPASATPPTAVPQPASAASTAPATGSG